MEIKGVGRLGVAAPGAGRAGGSPGFSVAAGAAVAGQAAVAAAGLDSLLALQEWDGTGTGDRKARKHGRAMLDALARLQVGLLGGGADDAALAELAALVGHCPDASDGRAAGRACRGKPARPHRTCATRTVLSAQQR